MKKKVDFLIRYEHKVRELESIMLIKCELERRGYSVDFIGNYDYKSSIEYQPKVLISPAIYNDTNLIGDFQKYGPIKKIANLLWEQVVGFEEEEDINGPHNVFGIGQRAVTFCWGRQTQDRLVKAGVPFKNAPIVGMLNTDYLRGSLKSTLLSKEVLAKKYKLDKSKKWFFFISSFAYCELDAVQSNLIARDYGQTYLDDMTNISVKSRNMILDWFKKALQLHPEIIIIYRPHPDEAKKSTILHEMELQYPNFRVISDEALKHWIVSSDKIYNWYSTGIIDSFILNKPFSLLRPIKLSEKYDYRYYYYDCKYISDEHKFLNSYLNLDIDMPINESLFNYYYYIPNKYVYLSVCDILEKMLVSTEYDIHYSWKERFKIYALYTRPYITKMLKPILYPVLLKLGLLSKKHEQNKIFSSVLKAGFEKNVATQKDIKEISERITPLINGVKV